MSGNVKRQPIRVTRKMIADANWALRNWLVDGRADRTCLDEQVNAAVQAVLRAALGGDIVFDNVPEGRAVLPPKEGDVILKDGDIVSWMSESGAIMTYRITVR